jgi:pilus assembly protein CpaE
MPAIEMPETRATVVVALPPGEQERLTEELVAAGFGVLEASGPSDLIELAESRQPFDLIAVDASVAPKLTVSAIDAMRRGGRRFATLYVTSPDAFDAVEDEGVGDEDEFVLRPATAESIRWRIEAMVIRSSGGEDGATSGSRAGGTLHRLGGSSPIIAVFNPKGGVGKTTVAANLAAMLQVRKSRNVLLVDADTVTGHVALSLGIRSVRGIADSWGSVPDEDEPIINLATLHSSGVRVATLTADPLALADLNPGRVVDSLLAARSAVDTIIVDLHPSYTDMNLAIFAAASIILVPVTPDLPAIRAAVQLTQVATQLGVRDRLALVVNRVNSGVSVGDIERTTRLKAIAGIRSAGMLLVRAGNVGRSLVQQFPKEKVTSDFDFLADRVLELVGATIPAPASAELAHRKIPTLTEVRVGVAV